MLRHSLSILCSVVLLTALPGLRADCSQEGRPATSQEPGIADSLDLPRPYTFDRPDAAFKLDNDLREISGLTLLDDQHLGAVQDEGGELYILDLSTGDIVREEKFAKNGDYEGIERVGERVFVLRSDGTLFEIADWQAKDYDAIEHETWLDTKNDTESLAYDAANNRLLIACKEDPGDDLDGRKAIYAFDLATKRLLDRPVYTIPVETFTEEMGSDGAVNDAVRGVLESTWDLSGFKPSALAFHPITGHLYVVSSVRKAIVVLGPEDGKILDVWPLPEDLLPQPEGLAFLPNGDLFLASEGRSKKAVLARFQYTTR